MLYPFPLILEIKERIPADTIFLNLVLEVPTSVTRRENNKRLEIRGDKNDH